MSKMRPCITLRVNNQTGHVVALKALLVWQRRFLACCLPFTHLRAKSAPVGAALS